MSLTCPLCQKKLSLKQVNYNLAVYICEDLKCKYPVGYECIVVERKLENMHENPAENDDLDDWIEDVVESKNDPSDWIDNLVEEAAKKASNEVTGDCDASDFDEILNLICG
ncbi:hypothetical protein TcasGA2_TC005766 [Tribolium castaneum]|uniref:Uncharacterized protein n=1 Tax=Tribolium castaneum TaxID=7070 RepID=D6WWD9_TRICA|nr:PREDICTED: uncharacterized protein LOC661303 isoform X2 [Tribolium castaneum]EFA08148.2 hypothetical protein TcasGA2_TC005766 [Tribolium castaneum]|eukprot:XP_976071.1 PREDICTED: uncharacterized protein LOC661303 isoform X2 [Tribolium castaneum]